MKQLKKFRTASTIILTSICIHLTCNAHFIWIETPQTTTIGNNHILNIFFGEVNFDTKETSPGRLDEMNDLKTTCLNPKNEASQLPLTKQKDRFTTNFTPKETGIYQILTTNTDANVMNLTKANLGIVKPMYYSRQLILCLDKSNPNMPKTPPIKPYFDLDLIPELSNTSQNSFPVNKPINFYAYFKKIPTKGGKIFAHAPNGWSKEIDADQQGFCSFTPLWEGQYVIDWTYTENSSGTYKDKPFETIRHRTVLTIYVTK